MKSASSFEADQRALEHGGEGQVVVGQEDDAAGAIRSMTAICSVTAMRSAPAIGTPLRFQRAVDGIGRARRACGKDENAARPDRARLPHCGRVERLAARDPAANGGGDAAGEHHLGAVLAEVIERLRPNRRRRVLPGLVARPDDDAAGIAAAAGAVHGRSRPAVRPAWTCGAWKTASTAARIYRHRAERQVELEVAPTVGARRGRGGQARAGRARTRPARRPGTRRSTVSRRRPRKRADSLAPAPSPAKNSSTSARITCHWRGLVSCASSTRM